MAYNIFGGDYTTAVDRPKLEYSYRFASEQNNSNLASTPMSDTVGGGLDLRDIGISAPPMQDQLQALKAKIFQGASKVELGFMGKGKGSMQGGNITPEMFGAWERQDIRELAEINKIQLSTHATPNAGSMAGLVEGGFSEQARESALHEIERAIDFAADTTKGGAVVVHTGEYPRPIQPYYGKTKEEKDRGEASFTAYEEEKTKAQFYLVDDRTGQMISQTRKNLPVMLPEWKTRKRADGTEEFVMDENNEYREAEVDSKGIYKTVERDWSYFTKLAEDEYKQTGKKVTPEFMQYKESQQAQLMQMKGWARLQGADVPELSKDILKIDEALKYYQQLSKDLPESERWRLRESIPKYHFIPPDVVDPVNYLTRLKQQTEFRMAGLREQAKSYEQQAAEVEKRIKSTVPIQDYAEKRTAETVARAAIFAMQKTEQMKQWDQNKGKDITPLYIALENVFPEQFGGHPAELKEIIVKSREEMQKRLKNEFNYSDDDAKKRAEDHIKITFDTGHANTWRKYFESDPRKSAMDNEKEFKKWYMDQVESLAKDNMIAHIHLTDNFGWEDEHTTPGQGTTPIKEFIERMKKAGVKDIIVEPGHQDYKAMMGAWREFGSSIYGLSGGTVDRWRFPEAEFSYFGRNNPPYFLYGESAPDPEQWVLWSQTRLE